MIGLSFDFFLTPTSAFCSRVTCFAFATLSFAHLKNGNATYPKMVVDAVLYLPSDDLVFHGFLPQGS